MGRLLFLCPEKKGGKAFSPFFARREGGDLGRALARQKKSPLRLALRPLRGARLRPFGGGTHCPLEKNAPDRPGFAPPKKAPRSAPLRAVFLRLKAPFFKGPGRAGRRGGGEGRCHIRATPWDKMWGRGDCDGQCQSRAFLPRAVDAGQCRNGRGARQTDGAAGRALPQP